MRWVTIFFGQRKGLNPSHLNDSLTLILLFLGKDAIPTVPISESSNIQRLRPSTVPSVPIIPIFWRLLIPRALSDYAEGIDQNQAGNSMPSAGGSVGMLGSTKYVRFSWNSTRQGPDIVASAHSFEVGIVRYLR
ncbi:hypothetical protein ASPBRDRAFT_673218 [Aspergillus brasiliensis CBS 101740]|uniref:Uncharacterized protein n=1 Tax=Aspergillus brasiliensis (strain CBS 101740 / IMI 381727 / IBT 21946) TaxID=767769 RepID=A0A1L9UML8_ASPBC|nr:hypothetical protein ASPBRDRAFT_673218 [Aspergillus brasiliensis CBS 101740]